MFVAFPLDLTDPERDPDKDIPAFESKAGTPVGRHVVARANGTKTVDQGPPRVLPGMEVHVSDLT